MLLAGKIPSEAEGYIRPLLDKTVNLFGDPISTMRDLMKAGPKAVSSIRKRGNPDLLCHYHFLRAVGLRLLEASYSLLQSLLKQSKVRSQTRELLSELRRYRKSGSYKGRFGPGHVREDLLALIHWTLEGGGKKKPLYPFSLPPLEFFGRCRKAMQRAERWVPSPRNKLESRVLQNLGSIVARVDNDKRFAETAEKLEKTWGFFCELRDVLRMSDADLPLGNTSTQEAVLPAEKQQRLKAIEKATKEYVQRLRDKVNGQPKRKPLSPEKVILKYWTEYGDGLFGHPVIYDEQGAVIAVAERTNNS